MLICFDTNVKLKQDIYTEVVERIRLGQRFSICDTPAWGPLLCPFKGQRGGNAAIWSPRLCYCQRMTSRLSLTVCSSISQGCRKFCGSFHRAPQAVENVKLTITTHFWFYNHNLEVHRDNYSEILPCLGGFLWGFLHPQEAAEVSK